MNILFNNDRLLRLITNLHTLTGIWANIFDINGKDIQIIGSDNPFCRLINADPEGHARCEACDAAAVKRCAALRGITPYRCHAGICEVVLPISESGIPIAYLVFGQILDDTPIDQQWENTRSLLGWYKGDMEQLHRSFLSTNQYTKAEIDAYAELLEALTSYIQLEGIIRSAEYTDVQRLEMYLDQHYMEPLSLKKISSDLHMGTTKLCSLAKKLSGGSTLTHIIAERRINAAKGLLIRGDAPVSAVAEDVGFSDYNYFTKIFKSITGLTPSAYRKKYRTDSQNG